MNCARCGHPRAIHLTDACRIGGCACTGFSDGSRSATGPRRVALELPAGYRLTVTLSPIEGLGHDPEAATAALLAMEDSRAEELTEPEEIS
jgi:hypothetical protein